MRPKGKLITLEGGEGAGKSSTADALKIVLEEHRHRVLLTQEPAATELGKQIWRLFQLDQSASSRKPIHPTAELFLFAADRAQHVAEIVVPALEDGKVVLCARYVDSTLAYQGYGRGLNLDHLRAINYVATGGLLPDITLLLDVPVEIGLSRKGGESQSDYLGQEGKEFHARVRKGYLELAVREPKRFQVIDATLSPDEVSRRCWEPVRRLLDQISS